MILEEFQSKIKSNKVSHIKQRILANEKREREHADQLDKKIKN